MRPPHAMTVTLMEEEATSMRRSGFILALLVCQSIPSLAQDKVQEVRVTYVAGANVYIAAGRSQGIFPGDTLTVFSRARKLERIEVLSSMSDRSVLRYIDESFGLEVGSILQIVREKVDAENLAYEVSPVVPVVAPEEQLAEEAFDAGQTEFIRPGSDLDVSGRLLIGANSLRSRTKSVLAPNESSARTYLTPYAMLSLDAEGLPHGLGLRVRMRSEYRSVSGGRASNPELSVRTYDLYLTREFEAATVRVGRFSNQYVPTGGYWDGILIDTGDGDFGYGGSFGFVPVRSNEQVSLDMPKAALFAKFTRRSEEVTNRLETYYLEIHPTNDLLTRRLFGLRHRMNWSHFGTYSRFELDRDPQSGRWVITRLSGRLSSTLTNSMEIHGRYDLRQPYSIYRSFDVISYRRDQINAGLGYRGRSLYLSADFVWNYAYDAGDRRQLDGRSITGSASLPRLRGVGITTSGSYWWSDLGSSMYGMVSLSRSFGKVSGRVYYQMSGSSRFETNLTTHSVATQVAFPLGPRLRSTSRIRFQKGDYVSSTAFETRLSIRL